MAHKLCSIGNINANTHEIINDNLFLKTGTHSRQMWLHGRCCREFFENTFYQTELKEISAELHVKILYALLNKRQ